jgi:hypothetical protein
MLFREKNVSFGCNYLQSHHINLAGIGFVPEKREYFEFLKTTADVK